MGETLIQLTITDKHGHRNQWKWLQFTDRQVLKIFSEWLGQWLCNVAAPLIAWGASFSPNTQAGHVRISEPGAWASAFLRTPQWSQVGKVWMKKSEENYNKEELKMVNSEIMPFKESVVFQKWGKKDMDQLGAPMGSTSGSEEKTATIEKTSRKLEPSGMTGYNYKLEECRKGDI